MQISELVFGALTQNRSSLEPSLGFAAVAPARHIVDTYKPLKSRCGTPKVVAHQAGRQCCAGPPPVRKINSKGTAVLNARRAGNRGKPKRRPKTTPVLVKAPNTDPEIGHNSPRARPCARHGARQRPTNCAMWHAVK